MCCGIKTTSQILHITGWRANCRIHHRGSRSVWTTLTKTAIVIGDCLGSLSVAGVEHSGKKQLGEERVDFVLQSTLEGIWGKDSRQAPLGRNQSTDVKGSLLTCSTWLAQSGFLFYPRPPARGGTAPCGPLHLSTAVINNNKKCFTDLLIGNLAEAFSQRQFGFPEKYHMCQVNKKLNRKERGLDFDICRQVNTVWTEN